MCEYNIAEAASLLEVDHRLLVDEKWGTPPRRMPAWRFGRASQFVKTEMGAIRRYIYGREHVGLFGHIS